MTTISMIACVGKNNEIGRNNKLLIRNKEDFNWFKQHTMGKVCVMGRKTYESLGKKTLKGRVIVVLTRDADYNPHPNIIVRHSVEEILHEFRNERELMICGGEEIYKLFLPFADKLYITRIHKEFDKADSFFPRFSSDYKEFYFYESRHGSTPMTFHVYRKVNNS